MDNISLEVSAAATARAERYDGLFEEDDSIDRSLGPRIADDLAATTLLPLHPMDWLGVPLPLSLPLAVLLLGICAAAGAALVALWCALVQRLGADLEQVGLGLRAQGLGLLRSRG